MKDISIYFQGVETEGSYEEGMLGNIIEIHTPNNFPDLSKKGIALIYAPEYRNASGIDSTRFTNNFRKHLYQLFQGASWEDAIYDLGTIMPGKTVSDTSYAINAVCQELIKKDINPVLIGGSQDLTSALYNAYEKLEQLVNLTTVDSQFDLGNINNNIHHQGWLSHILLQQSTYLFNYSNIGLQGHYTSKQTLDLFNDLYFDVCRLGEINQSIELAEPIMRNTDILSVDLTAIRASDMQNPLYTAPNGLFAHEACRIMRYAGISDKLSTVGIFNYYSEENSTTDELVAQMIWYFIEGYENRKGDFPIGSKKNYTKFRVFIEELNEEIIFYKSDKSGRWWIEVPYPKESSSKYMRHQMVPCSIETYQEAMKGDIPNLWWKTYQKFA